MKKNNKSMDASRKQIIFKYKMELAKYNKICLPITFLTSIILIILMSMYVKNESTGLAIAVIIIFPIMIISITIWVIQFLRISIKKDKEIEKYEKQKNAR